MRTARTAWAIARANTSGAAPSTRWNASSSAGPAPVEPVDSANTVSPSTMVCDGRTARPRPSWVADASLAACALVSPRSVATTPMVVFSAASRPSGGPPHAATSSADGARSPPNSPLRGSCAPYTSPV